MLGWIKREKTSGKNVICDLSLIYIWVSLVEYYKTGKKHLHHSVVMEVSVRQSVFLPEMKYLTSCLCQEPIITQQIVFPDISEKITNYFCCNQSTACTSLVGGLWRPTVPGSMAMDWRSCIRCSNGFERRGAEIRVGIFYHGFNFSNS